MQWFWSYVSFSKVTLADLEASAASDSGVTEMLVILPLKGVNMFPEIILDAYSPEAEEVLDLLLASLVGDPFDVNGGRHGPFWSACVAIFGRLVRMMFEWSSQEIGKKKLKVLSS
jgi:hypothetical protein